MGDRRKKMKKEDEKKKGQVKDVRRGESAYAFTLSPFAGEQ